MESDCHEHKVSATMSNVYFAKQNGLIKPAVFYITFDCCRLTRPEPEHYPCFQAWPVQTSSIAIKMVKDRVPV
jgi:hypothetical protein